MYRAITSPASRHNISLINIFLLLSTLVNMSSVPIAIGGCKFTTMGTGAKFRFCVDSSDVAQDCISRCLNQITCTAFIFAHTIHIKPDGCPLAGWYIMCTRYGSVGQHGWTMGRCRGGCGCARGRLGEDVDGPGVGVGEDRQGSLGMGAELVPVTCLPGEAAAMVVTSLEPTIAASKRGPNALNGCLATASCTIANPSSCIFNPSYLFRYALPEQPNPFYSFLSLLLIHLICPCQQSKYLASFTPL